MYMWMCLCRIYIKKCKNGVEEIEWLSEYFGGFGKGKFGVLVFMMVFVGINYCIVISYVLGGGYFKFI